ncbi:Beige -like protein 1 [Ceratocystis fimbriata CBS 114723]|uniref:Beige protein homolog 1 n=1 Tax=Ceratocystis fimbriata CBS 114723 TaxID=1035309 RepID=A0A2C5WZ54_9PEZI|nr:Beige -like protein 1 [Ceratocystis fimbriata CBS 114723]
MATPTPRRYRSVTTSSIPPSVANDVLASLLDSLRTASEPLPPVPSAPTLKSSPASALSSSSSPAPPTYPSLPTLSAALQKISVFLTSRPAPNPFQDDFRHQDGFGLLLTALHRFSGFYNPCTRTKEETSLLFEFLRAWLDVLGAVLAQHSGNRRFFKRKVGGGGASGAVGGWETLEATLANIGLGGSLLTLAESSESASWAVYSLFGKLLSFALGDKAFDTLFDSVVATETSDARAQALAQAQADEISSTNEGDYDSNTQSTKIEVSEDSSILIQVSAENDSSARLASLTAQVRQITTPTTHFHNPDILRATVNLWLAMARSKLVSSEIRESVSLCSWLVLRVLASAVSISMFNLSALHGSGALSDFLRVCFSTDPSLVLASAERSMLMNLCKMLMYLGIPTPADTQFLLTSKSPDALGFSLEMASQYAGPAFFQFDLSLYGYSAVELPTIGRPFPPVNSPGYTFTAWLRIDRFDPATHTTIFGVFDASQTCFLMLYLEKDTHNFILQTSVTSSRPSVRFKAIAFEERTWYHVALVHRRPRTMSSSKASLYVNGEFIEQVRCGYPLAPLPASTNVSGLSGDISGFGGPAIKSTSAQPQVPVQAFLGTPRNLSSRHGAGKVSSKWSLASAHLLDDALSDDFLAVHYGLGPRYQGNFQDSLGGFQTYEASATLGLRNEMLHPGKDESSDILRAIRGKASLLLPENKTLLSFFPTSVYRDDIVFHESNLFHWLPRQAAVSLANVFRRGGPVVAVNAAVPFLPEAFMRPHGMAVLSGNPTVVTPSYIDDNMWRLAGFTPVALKLLHSTQSAEDMLRVVEIIFTCVRHSWRNSDAMERDNGYAILGLLLRAKLGFGMPTSGSDRSTPVRIPALKIGKDERDSLTLRLLKLVLKFVGYNNANPIESFIVNPLAYRILLIDVDTWRRSAIETQELYYSQFTTFAVQSKYHDFNSRRLVRMRIIKRLLEALKSESLTEEIIPAFKSAFEALVKSNFSSEVQRALALFITYMLRATGSSASSLSSTPASINTRITRPRSASNRSLSFTPAGARRPTIEVNSPGGASTPPTFQNNNTKVLPRRQIGIRILGWYSNLLCDNASTAAISKFARTVTNKWLLYLLTEDDAEAVVYGTKILARVLVTHGATYTAKFAAKTGGFAMMAARLRRWWDIPTLWPICFSIMFGYDVAAIDFERTFDFFSLMDIFQSPRVVCPEALPVIMAMLQHGVKQIVSLQGHPESPASPRTDAETQGQQQQQPSESSPSSSSTSNLNTSAPVGRRPRARSMELSQALGMRKDVDKIAMRVVVIQTITRFLADLHASSSEFRDFALSSDYSSLLLSALYPIIVSTDAVSPEIELNSTDSTLTFDGGDVMIRPMAGSTAAPIVRRASPHRERSETVPSMIGGGGILGSGLTSQASVSGGSSTSRLQRASSFVLLTSDAISKDSSQRKKGPSSARLTPLMSPVRESKTNNSNNNNIHMTVPEEKSNAMQAKKTEDQQTSNTILQGLLELVIAIFSDQILNRKEFPGFNLACKIPPGFQEHQAYFESYILRNTIQHLKTEIELNLSCITEPRILMNLARFNVHVVVDSIFAGWFIGGADSMLEFTGLCLEYLQQSNVAALKSVRLCSQAVTTLRGSFFKVMLLQLSDMDDAETVGSSGSDDAKALAVMDKIMYWQAAILSSLESGDEYMRLLLYQLYVKLVDSRPAIRVAAATIMRIMMVQKPEAAAMLLRPVSGQLPVVGSSLLGRGNSSHNHHTAMLLQDFEVVTEMDNEAFLDWVDSHRESLDTLFFGNLAKSWEDFVATENQRTAESARGRLARRKDRLRHWHSESMMRSTVLHRHTMSNSAWMKSIYHTEHTRHQRLMQDRTDDMVFLTHAYTKMDRHLTRPGAGSDAGGVVRFPDPAEFPTAAKWKLDRTEGRNRMRLRLLPDYSTAHSEYQPKRRHTDASVVSMTAAAASLRVNAPMPASGGPGQPRSRAVSDTRSTLSAESASISIVTDPSGEQQPLDGEVFPEVMADGDTEAETQGEPDGFSPEDDFELIDDPNDAADGGDDGFEDKNRKVMRRLQPDDSVQAVFNISRIIGLEAAEGILIVGKDALYMMDGVFHCASGEIVNAWQAPPDERDPYSQIIMDPKATATATAAGMRSMEQESRHWRWDHVLSISKRRFLFRDVAIEVFFTDGRSYLLTTIDPIRRNDLFMQLSRKAPHSTGAAAPSNDDAWRLESLRVLRVADDTPTGFGLGSRIGGLFSQATSNPLHAVTRRWQRGEMSNFHYLMMINTMAGRTFNDLTQYPVFPWVLADYTSTELNLNDPATFRDLSKPMGAQTPGRISAYHENYAALAEIGEKPFHYGTHYSTAMIVSSYLIRLPPFVHSFILLQGGAFDHADRLFHSIPSAWRSASAEHKTDVRELIPEFFCLPEFLSNINGYAFGTRESTGTPVDDVELPPWAHGDPKIFVQKNREALECPYVSQNLHAWIDLVFGYKQVGDQAVDNMNVFHWQSYEGARNLDDIEDLQEKRIAAGVIHNFGQTPKMVFSRPHPQRENMHPPGRRLDTSVYGLTRVAAPILETHHRVASLIYATKLDRLLVASPFRRHFAPYEKYLDFGFADASVRFFFSESRKSAGLCENLHSAPLSAVLVPDSKTLVTAGEDCVISVFAMHTSHGRPVDLALRKALFGHRRPVEILAASTAFSMLVSISEGQACVWDLNRLEFVRRLHVPSSQRVESVAVSEANGDILIGVGSSVVLYNINGEVILNQRVTSSLSSSLSTTSNTDDEDTLHTVAFYDGSGTEWVENDLIFTGHRRGKVTVWKRVVKNGCWALQAVRMLNNPESVNKSGSGSNGEQAP